jgi:hypothetical protein
VNTDCTEYQTSDEEYLDYIQEHDAEYAMLRDYPLGSDPDATVPELQQRTTEHQRRLFNRWNISTTPVAVIQGRSPRQYLNHVCQLRDAGILKRTNRVAIGSLVGRTPTEKHRVITAVADSLGDNTRIHGLGVQVSDLSAYPQLLSLLATGDSNAWDYTTGGTWREKAYAYVDRRQRLADLSVGENQRRLPT